MKKISILIVALTMIVVLFGCRSNQSQSEVIEDAPSMFVKVEDGSVWDVYYHKDTKVMYVVSYSSYNRGNFTMLVNADGSPMLWEE